ncbi:hypothetical protein [Sphingosinithalassobacter portus]|uniref:hypothetical protein n=1 Tax=Stakelama portus TaxID=2676234 RepID=UPI000D6E4F10|nr:hypothetical protein [Sphingosinithalassobacter portus]
MTLPFRVAGPALALALSLSLAGCGGGTAERTDRSDDDAKVGAAGDFFEIEDGDKRLLGSVNLPRPDWLPAGMPFPADAHIVLVTHIKRDAQPDLFMIQANSFVKPAPYAQAFLLWAESKGLDPERDARYGDDRPVVGFKGADGSPASLQITPQEGGVSRIMIAFAGPL